jgi:SAM-dependent methyltransferase
MAESFGVDARRYDRARPRYPQALIERLVGELPGLDVLDVGCGTGIAARQLQAAGCRVLGVDVDARMAEFARANGTPVEVAAFETWDAAGRTFDAVTAGQTWHWIDPVAGPAKAEQLLRPGGRLALFWNAFQPPAEIADGFAEVYRRVVPDSPLNPWARSVVDSYAGIFDKTAATIGSAGAFGPAEQWRFEWDRPYTRDEWLDGMPTSGEASLLSPTTLGDLMDGSATVIDAAGGAFTMHFTTVAIVAARLSTSDTAG